MNFLAYEFIVLSDYDIIEPMVMVTAWMKIMQSVFEQNFFAQWKFLAVLYGGNLVESKTSPVH